MNHHPQDDDPLSDKEEAFAIAYANNGGNGSAAAIEAGYSAKGASVTANRLLKRRRVRDRIRELKTGLKGAAMVVMDAAIDAARAAREGLHLDPVTVSAQREADEDRAAGLRRAYVIAGLIDNFEIALGRRSTKITKIVRAIRKDENGNVTVAHEGVQIETFMVDGATANRAGELLMRECDRLEGAAGGMPPESKEHGLDEMIVEFKKIAGIT